MALAPIAPKLFQGHADARTVVDDVLRPIALRLRVARKDQERVRQAFATLQRMVPVRPMRRGFRAAMQRRPAFADAWWMLEALAPLLEGEFAAARADWAEHLARPGTEPAPQDEPAEAAEDGAARPGRRRRGRRGGRGRRKDPIAAVTASPAHSAPAAAAAPAAPVKKLPAVWSDDYFFAALPSVPELAAEDVDTDRYGASRVAAAEVAAAAPSGPAALDILARIAHIDLLFTDVVLPDGMDGRQLANAALRLKPDLKVLFTTGYSRNAIVHNGRLDPGVQLVPKPFTFNELAAKVRRVLDERA